MNEANGRELEPHKGHTPAEERGALIQYSGPLPPAAEFQRYEQVLPGAADRILTLAEKQAEHRRAVEREVVASGITAERLGAWFAFLLVLSGLGGGVFLALNDKLGGAFASILLPLATVAGVFVYQQRKQRE